MSSDASLIQTFLKEQPVLLEIQRKMEFDALKEILQNWLSPEDAGDDIDEDEDETPVEVAPVKAYVLKTPLAPKANKADQFDSLFEDEDESNDLPF